MEIETKKLKEIVSIGKIITKDIHSYNYILKSIKIENGFITITNLTNWINIKLNESNSEQFIIPLIELNQLLPNIKEKTITITQDDNCIVLKTNDFTYFIQQFEDSTVSYPSLTLPPEKFSFNIPVSVIQYIIQAFHIITDAHNLAYNGVYLQIDGNIVKIFATNSFHLIYYIIKVNDHLPNINVILNPKLHKILEKINLNTNNVTLKIYEMNDITYTQIIINNITITSENIMGRFPNYVEEVLIKNEDKNNYFTINLSYNQLKIIQNAKENKSILKFVFNHNIQMQYCDGHKVISTTIANNSVIDNYKYVLNPCYFKQIINILHQLGIDKFQLNIPKHKDKPCFIEINNNNYYLIYILAPMNSE
jgi:DNA polymerase III sliding clamp (beta) subunit (PCNA family)